MRENAGIGGDRAGNEALDAAAFAAAQVAAVRDDPAGRLALARTMYEEPAGTRAPRLRFQRAALAFMRWMADRGALGPLESAEPGSRWWRAMNERLLRELRGARACRGTRGLAFDRHGPALDGVHRPAGGADLVPGAQRECGRGLSRVPRPCRRRGPNRVLLPQRRPRARPVRPRARRRPAPRARPHRPLRPGRCRSKARVGRDLPRDGTRPPRRLPGGRRARGLPPRSSTGSVASSTSPSSSLVIGRSTTGRRGSLTCPSSPRSSWTVCRHTRGRRRAVGSGSRRHSPSRRERSRGSPPPARARRSFPEKENAPSRWRLRPASRLTAAEATADRRAINLGRSVLGASGTLGAPSRAVKETEPEVSAFCELFFSHSVELRFDACALDSGGDAKRPSRVFALGSAANSPSRERFRPPSRPAFRFRVQLLGGLRPTGAPCSAQGRIYARGRVRSRGRETELRAICGRPDRPLPGDARTAPTVGRD
jgi:hypothetical protein